MNGGVRNELIIQPPPNPGPQEEIEEHAFISDSRQNHQTEIRDPRPYRMPSIDNPYFNLDNIHEPTIDMKYGFQDAVPHNENLSPGPGARGNFAGPFEPNTARYGAPYPCTPPPRSGLPATPIPIRERSQNMGTGAHLYDVNAPRHNSIRSNTFNYGFGSQLNRPLYQNTGYPESMLRERPAENLSMWGTVPNGDVQDDFGRHERNLWSS